MDDVIIYHNPECGTSRNTLGLIRNAGIEPHVIEYLKCPPSRAMLQALIARMGISVRDVVRVKGTPYHDLGLDDPAITDDQLARCHDGASNPDQPADRGDAARRQAVPAFGDRARFACRCPSAASSGKRMASWWSIVAGIVFHNFADRGQWEDGAWMKRSPRRYSTCCSSALAIRRVRSWRRRFSIAPDRGDFARSRLEASPRAACIPMPSIS